MPSAHGFQYLSADGWLAKRHEAEVMADHVACEPMYLKNADRVVYAFSQCVERMPEKMAWHRDNVKLVEQVLMPPGEPIPLFVLSGSSKFRPTNWGSDIDVRFVGTNFEVLLDRLAELQTRVSLVYKWRARNQVTLYNQDLSLDLLVVNDFHDVMPFGVEPWMTQERRDVVNNFNLTMGTKLDPIPYTRERADAIDTVYGIALGSRLGRAVVAYLKMLDAKMPTCMTVVVAALAVDCIPEERLASPCAGLDVALEIASQFAHRFVQDVRHENHIFWSFKEVWGGFCDKYLRAFRNQMKLDPLRALYVKSTQHTRVKDSLMWVQLCNDYPIVLPNGPGRMLDQPRNIPLTAVRELVIFCVATTTRTEHELRVFGALYGGYFKMTEAYCQTAVCPPSLATFILPQEYSLREGVASSLECLVYPSSLDRFCYRLADS